MHDDLSIPHPRAAIYARVSSEEQRERQSIQTQIAYAERYIARENVPVSDWYKDDGISGTLALGDRPDGARLLRDARAGRFKTLLIYKLDRLGREALVILSALDDMSKAGVEVVSMTETLDLATPHGRFMAVIQAGAAGYERDSIVQRSMEGTERLARAGAWQGGIVPYGYRVEGRNKDARLVISDVQLPNLGISEADVIRLIYRLTVRDNLSCHLIAEHLNMLGVPTAARRAGKTVRGGATTRGIWVASRVRNMLAATIYKGLHQYGKRSKHEGREVIERECPAIVSVQDWEQAQAVMRSHRDFSRRNAKRDYLLRGLMKCAYCGLTYCGHAGPPTTRADGTIRLNRRYYTCNGRYRSRDIRASRTPICAGANVIAEEAEAHIWNRIKAFRAKPNTVIEQIAAQLQADREDDDRLSDQIAGVNAEIGALKGQRDTVIALFRRGRIDEHDLDRQLDQLAEEEATLRRRATWLSAQAEEAAEANAQLRGASAVLAELQAVDLDALPFERRREIVAQLVRSIVVETVEQPDGKPEPVLHITYRFDPTATRTEARSTW